MNRPIKFRAWDKERKKWLSNFTISHDGLQRGLERWIGDRLEWRNLNANLFSLSQFTGLLDKNGKEIYEGDIVQTSKEGSKKFIYEVMWQGLGWAFMDIVGNMPIRSIFGKEWIQEVIGDIYSNPELLTK